MPELPEVETIRRDLSRLIIGARIVDVIVSLSKFVSPRRLFEQRLVGRRITSLKRYGKLLVFALDGNYALQVHLKMTGQIVLRHKGKVLFGGHPIAGLLEVPNRYTHLTISLSTGDVLYVNDLRQFGYAKLFTTEDSQKIVSRFGIDPLLPSFTFAVFEGLLKKATGRTVKAFLLDQSKMSGLGNIYTDESCFAASIKPTRRAGTLTGAEQKKLYKNIRAILKCAVAKRGTTSSTYERTYTKAGSYTRYLKVYGRAGKPCQRCGRPLSKARVSGRGTVYCFYCQA
ncbi:DNA-formamidopyrimidine glycosylase [Candidatus Uhrbacteria bacterium CG10_big_fil_rev_8_21_14_0_10_48_11]|uniref:DNA-formamidopyrimidine glycosylase n=1 Tax=Candidatus Uhrbacteria bacterium CG10_big_fil_rev_8_21_14_0_10_48_11 TaxID=1975037 RepID=A0A2M8LDV3_9BACT|nr:MAG: DNA-formamidopyrimidine glycosylase [Candidatus Uhrbacteria bacterium CG10_big_fil_rev_8_21_14_0_10_48_11]